MNLTEHEKRDLLKYIESGRDLPDDFRFKLFKEKSEVELVWNGKTNEVTNIVLPFQTIEHIDEPRSEAELKLQQNLFDTSGKQIRGWTNKLIWGDNKLILSSLKDGPLRQEIEEQGGIKLIYIDPPFDVGADFSMKINIGDDEFTKQPNVLEELAYRDTWGKGADSFIAMMYERLMLMRDLLNYSGTIAVQCDWRVVGYMRLILDEIFGKKNLVNQITWKRTFAHGDTGQGAQHMGRISDYILLYKKSEDFKLNPVFTNYDENYIENTFKYKDKDGRRWQSVSLTAPGGASKGNPYFEFMGIKRFWQYSKENLEKLKKEDKIYQSNHGTVPRKKMYLDESQGIPLQDIWTDISPVQGQAIENLNYPTQKPEKLIERIIKASSNKNDIVCDFFAGSGTTLAVAEKLGRKWIGTDLGRFSIHTTRKRMINAQRELKKDGKDFRAFEILNLGKYERQYYVGQNPDLKDEERYLSKIKKQEEFKNLILSAYKAEKIEQIPPFDGKKRDRMVKIGPIDLPITQSSIEDVVIWAKKLGITKVDVLCFDTEMGINIDDAKAQGIDLAIKIIPPEVFDKRAIERGHVKFYDIAYTEVKPIVKKTKKSASVAIELTDFSVSYSQEDIKNIEENLRGGQNKIVLDEGMLVKISKDKESGIIEREVLTKKWTDWIDYWSVDYDFESKKEFVREIDEKDKNKFKEKWTGDYIFENEWQSFRTKKDRKLELTSAFKEISKGRRKIAIKVIDIFGNDTTKVIEVNI